VLGDYCWDYCLSGMVSHNVSLGRLLSSSFISLLFSVVWCSYRAIALKV